jgi:EmrB/QacA subfamily drug resistance transporter
LAGTILSVLDSSILNISVLPILREFQTDMAALEWVLTSYNLTFAMFLIGLGRLGDLAGRRWVYLVGQAVFVLGSGLGGLARGTGELVAFRAIQGLGASALAPSALAILVETFPEEERGAALGVWGAAAGIAGAVGPTVGGMVADALGWRTLFFMNVPLGITLILAAALVLPTDGRRVPWAEFDALGFALLSGLLGLVGLLLLGPPGRLGGPVFVAALIGGILCLLIIFAWHERRSAHPLVDLATLRLPAIWAANASVFFALLIMAGGMFLTVLYAQLLGSYSSLWVGLLLAPCAATSFLLSPIGGRLCDRVGARPLAVAGLGLLFASVLLPAIWRQASPAALVVLANMAAGAGVGLATPALVRTATEAVEPTRVGMASGLYKTMNELGGVFGVVLLGSLLEARIVANALRAIPGHMLPADLNLKALSSLKDLEVHALQRGLLPADVSGFHRAIQDAVARGFNQVFWVATGVALVGLLVACLVPRRPAAVDQPAGRRARNTG